MKKFQGSHKDGLCTNMNFIKNIKKNIPLFYLLISLGKKCYGYYYCLPLSVWKENWPSFIQCLMRLWEPIKLKWGMTCRATNDDRKWNRKENKKRINKSANRTEIGMEKKLNVNIQIGILQTNKINYKQNSQACAWRLFLTRQETHFQKIFTLVETLRHICVCVCSETE